ncbi:pyrroline-5-carboxylate reductase [Neobacillus rhizosphaerae]|uniref:pyrroline-5-carboxylate reductase n=1 Tax=Neobacillus rhizosphaerae TaxID=2880965 RepID=UPI003D2A83F4
MLDKKSILFIGAGSMAEAMIAGIVSAEKIPSQQLIVSNRSNTDRLEELQENYGIIGVPREHLDIGQADIIVLAMKPKDAATSLQSIKHSLKPNQLILSVLAGVTTSFIEQIVPAGQQVIRVMPNTSSMIGESATAISAGKHTSKHNLLLSKELLQCIGEVYVLPEGKMDIFTGIAGSGPAYFYYLMEHMEKEGQKAGLQPETARRMIAQTILGAAKMIQEQEEPPAMLRDNVTSPNGTTAAGLKALKEQGGGKAIAQAIQQAASRSKEISAELEQSIKTVYQTKAM